MTRRKKTIMRICVILLLVVSLFVLGLCVFEISEPLQSYEQPKSYFKDIDVVVTDIDKKEYFAGTAMREVTIEVYSKEYNLTESFTEIYKGMFGDMPYMEYEKGDIVKASLCTVFMESTGKIIDRYIDKVY